MTLLPLVPGRIPKLEVTMASSPDPDIGKVRAFWDTEACGTHFVAAPVGTPEFYDAYRCFRYATEWHIPELIADLGAAGKKVLEIGVGNGADGVLLAQSGARYTGVDITETALSAAATHFRCMGLEGHFQPENAEHLSFPDCTFDIVYSYGALHHTPCPEKAYDEVYRVLKPNGKALIMLYHKHSFNYYVRVMGYMRLRVLLKIMARIGKWSVDRTGSNTHLEIRGKHHSLPWQMHYDHFLEHGWRYLAARNFVHHATDGPECPYAFVFTKRTVRELFSRYSKVETRVAHFPLQKYSGRFPRSIERAIASATGWYLIVQATK